MKNFFGMLAVTVLVGTQAQAMCTSDQWNQADGACANCASSCEVSGPTISYSCYGSGEVFQDWGLATNGGGSGSPRKVLSKLEVQAKLRAMGSNRPNRVVGSVKSIKLSR